MKRTVEIVLTVIGMLLFIIPIFAGFTFQMVKDNPQIRQQVENAVREAENSQNIEAMPMDVNQLFNVLGTFTMVILIAGILAIGLGILAIVFLKGNKKPKAAGIILIISAIVMTFATFALGLFGGAAYLVAGIVALVRKSTKPLEDEHTIESY